MIIIAHRGAKPEPENTLRSFRHAVAKGGRWIECDVRLTRDGVPVIIHDATINRTTDGHGRISGITFTALRELDAGKQEAIPSLKETIQFAKKNMVRLVLEIKDPRALAPSIKLVRANGRSPLPCISSFSPSVIFRAKKSMPSLSTGLIIANPATNWVRAAQRVRADMVHVFAPLVKKKKLHDAKRAGLKVWAWTINSKKQATLLERIGIDGIFTDFPERLIIH